VEAYRDAIAMLEEHRARLDRLTRALIESDDLDRLEIAAALGEPRARRSTGPAPGPRPEPALRREPSPRRPRARERGVRPRLVPLLAEALTAFLGRLPSHRRAPAA
jgi:hypothetical protein